MITKSSFYWNLVKQRQEAGETTTISVSGLETLLKEANLQAERQRMFGELVEAVYVAGCAARRRTQISCGATSSPACEDSRTIPED